ncbi:hypothetical protein PHYPSEUDO_013932 [Phytophthora pseudosyringae]|uniref:RxLR effector protein n=1 Tax=Phytophthora pseudosyringae TaxID=221518 RepID=A0A8T1V5C9_9STRA|nr:hypothetical protein PHYPSEUDO_013932 [Phytophthora pseudosyringae]
MRSFLLLLVLAGVAFATSDALSVTAPGSQLTLSKSELDQAVQPNDGGKRMLRASEGTDAADEERGFAEVGTKLKARSQILKTWVTNSKLVQTATQKVETLAQKLRIATVKGLIRKGATNEVMYANKVSPDEYFLALKLNPKLKFNADSAIARANNPDLEKFFTYSVYFNLKQ